MGILNTIEGSLGWLFSSFKIHDSDLLTSSPTINTPSTLKVTSPLGPSPSTMPKEYTQFSADIFPTISWTPEAGVASWLVIVQDPDAPLPFAAVHGIFYDLPASCTSISDADIHLVEGGGKGAGGLVKGTGKLLMGGFKAGQTIRGVVYAGPRPVLGHGAHRYFYQVLGLSERVEFGVDVPTKKDLLEGIRGKVVVWGSWVGVYDNKWE